MYVSNSSRPYSLLLTQLTQATYLGFPARRVLSGLSTVSCLQGCSSCILQKCPSHLNLPVFYHSIYLLLIVERVKFINVSCSPHTILNWTTKSFLISFFQRFGAYFHPSLRTANIHFRM